ncbi:MAG: hypothetical protein GXP31_11505 [Kiritimatiellaeota bacterium]|nr:hypothetical protein [Kiritimatiellota bacterium]
MNPYGAWLRIGLALCLTSVPRAWSAEDVRPQAKNVALGKAVRFNTPPNYRATTDPDDAKQLVDGLLSPRSPIWYDKSTVGWASLDPTVFTLDLGAVHPIRGVGLHIGAGRAGVEWPASIRIQVSDNGRRYSDVGNLMELLSRRPPNRGYASFWLVTDRLRTHGRFVRFVCSPVNLGNGAYIMLDEVEVYRGETAWLDLPLTWPDAPRYWRADWSEMKWADRTGSTPYAQRPTLLVLVDGTNEQRGQAPLQQAVPGPDGMTFTLLGEAGRRRSMSWTGRLATPISTEHCRYALMTFRAEGIRRTYHSRALVALRGLSDKAAANEVTLLEANMALNDGLPHTLLKPLPEGFTLHQLKVALHTEDDAPRLTLERLELLSEAPAVFNTEIALGRAPPRAGFLPVELGATLNGTLSGWYDRVLAKHKIAFDGARVLPAGSLCVSGVPFVIAAGDKDLALVPQTPEQNERVRFLGQTVDSRNLGPISRDDALSVEVDAAAREAFLLLALDARPVQSRGNLPGTALRLDDIECLSVELAYDRGRSEIAFPYSLADRGCYIPARELGAYAVACDPTRRLKKITLHARQFGLNFALAAVTLNTSGKALVPQLAGFPQPERTVRHPAPPARPVAVTLEDRRLTLGNRWYECSFDLSQGFVLDRFIHRWNPSVKIHLAPNSGLRVRIRDTVYTGRCFKAEVVRTAAAEAELRLVSRRPELPLEIAVTITASDSPELRFQVRARNLGDKPLAAELCLPALAGLSLGDLAATRLFFPQYRVVDTARSVVLRAPYGPEFSSQFMDVYSRRAGVGLMVRTDNREQRMADFTLRKDPGGVSGGVCFPAEFNSLGPGVGRAYPPVVLAAHQGDWHEAFKLYRDWVRTWYRPVKSQDEDYFLNAWDMQCYRPSEKLSWLEARIPAIISPDRKRFFVDEIFAFEQQYLGHVPDLVHFFNWNYNNEKNRHEHGVYGAPHAYEQAGGLAFFRRLIAEIQGKWKRPVSLYTISDRFRISAMPDQALAAELAAGAAHKQMEDDDTAALRGAGTADGIVFPGIGNERWTDFFVRDIAKMQRDTGCRIVYMDVFPRFSHLSGAPGVTPRGDDMNVIRRVRKALPDEVALWSEYPLTDVASQYADGCLQYYFLDLNQVFARRYNVSDRAGDLFMEMPFNLGRYALPRYRIFCLAGYAEMTNKPGQVDAVFVNGEAYFEDTYRLEYSRLRARINRAYEVKRQYADCFSSDDPTPWVQTAASGLTANLFPGKGRDLWTLFNGRPKTYSGVVLIVPHHPGAKYRDAWNGSPLAPAIERGMAKISLTLDPQQPGCVVQDWSR